MIVSRLDGKNKRERITACRWWQAPQRDD